MKNAFGHMFVAGVFLAGAVLFAPLAQVQAQTPAQALAEAQARLVCGSGTVLNAVYLPGGLLRATCRANAPRSSTTGSELPAALEGTALSAPAALGVMAAVVAVTVLLGEEDISATTTSTYSAGGGAD